MTSKPSSPEENQAAEPAVEADPTALDVEQLDQVRGDGTYPLPRGNFNTGPGG